MTHDRVPRNKPTQIFSTSFWQRHKSNSVEGQPFQQTILEQWDICKTNNNYNKSQPKFHTLFKNELKMDHRLYVNVKL